MKPRSGTSLLVSGTRRRVRATVRAAGRGLSACVLAASATGCGDSPEPAGDPAAAPMWGLEAVHEIGGWADEEEALTDVGQVLIGPDGDLFVAQPREGIIRVYDPGGSRGGTIGGPGMGPGEFSTISHMQLRGDTLYVADSRSGRGTLFSLAGEFRESTHWIVEPGPPPDGVGGYLPTVPQVRLDDGTGLVKPESFVPVGDGGVPSGVHWVPYLRVDGASQILDTLHWQHMEFASVPVTVEGREFGVWSPFEDALLSELVPDGRGVLVVDRSLPSSRDEPAFLVTLLGPRGDTVFTRAFGYDPAPMAEEALAVNVQRMHRLLEGRPGPTPDPERIAEALRDEGLVPPVLPPVTNLGVGQDGSVWLRREEASADEIPWDVVGASGDRIARVLLPREEEVAASDGGAVVTVGRDELDVPYLVRYRVQRPAGAP